MVGSLLLRFQSYTSGSKVQKVQPSGLTQAGHGHRDVEGCTRTSNGRDAHPYPRPVVVTVPAQDRKLSESAAVSRWNRNLIGVS